MARKTITEALGYVRTSSATNLGEDKDSERRQREAVMCYAKRAGYTVVGWYTDEAVKGDNAVMARPGFSALMERVAGNGVRTILVENATRFARDLIVQETGHRMLKEQGITLIAVDSPESFVEETPTSILIRQVLGAVSQFEKASLVAKLAGARMRKMKAQAERGETPKCGGRRSYREQNGVMVDLARRLHRYPNGGRRRSLRQIAEELRLQGYVPKSGTSYSAEAIRRMITQ